MEQEFYITWHQYSYVLEFSLTQSKKAVVFFHFGCPFELTLHPRPPFLAPRFMMAMCVFLSRGTFLSNPEKKPFTI